MPSGHRSYARHPPDLVSLHGEGAPARGGELEGPATPEGVAREYVYPRMDGPVIVSGALLMDVDDPRRDDGGPCSHPPPHRRRRHEVRD